MKPVQPRVKTSILCLLAFACEASDESSDTASNPDQESVSNPEVVDQPSPLDPDVPIESPSGCEGAWVAEILPRPWWLSESVTGAPIPHHDPPHAYDGCAPSEIGFNPDACGLPHRGARICIPSHTGSEGRITSTCLTAADCPESMVCVGSFGPGDIDEAVEGFGQCEKTCATEDAAACIRDDMWCDGGMGVCRPIKPSFEGEAGEERRERARAATKTKGRTKGRAKRRR